MALSLPMSLDEDDLKRPKMGDHNMIQVHSVWSQFALGNVFVRFFQRTTPSGTSRVHITIDILMTASVVITLCGRIFYDVATCFGLSFYFIQYHYGEGDAICENFSPRPRDV